MSFCLVACASCTKGGRRQSPRSGIESGWKEMADAAVIEPIAPASAPGATIEASAARQSAPASEIALTAAAFFIGAWIALSGFPPLNNLPHYLHMEALPALVLLSPACLAGLGAIWAAGHASSRRKVLKIRELPRPAAYTLTVLVAGAALSLTQSDNPGYSAALLVSGILAPGVLFLVLWSGRLPSAPLVAGFIATLVVLLVRADITFVQEYGFPTSQKVLFDAKFHSGTHGFHYYTLGNPDHTAGFLLLPFILCLFWAIDQATTPAARRWLLLASAVILFTIVLLYVRFADLVVLLVIVAAFFSCNWARALRFWAAFGAVSLALVAALLSPGHYFLNAFKSTPGGSALVRWDTISAGLRAFVHHPIAGLGLGQYHTASLPAHSSIVQGGAEMGVLGLIGVAMLTFSLVTAAARRLRSRHWLGLKDGALVAAALSALYAVISPPASEGLMVGFVSIYGLSLAIAAGVGIQAPHEPPFQVGIAVQVRTALAGLRQHLHNWLTSWSQRLWWPAYGLGAGVVAAAWISRRLPSGRLLTSSRETEYGRVLAAHHHGFGPLVAQVGPHSFLPAGMTDDPGGYLYAPWLADIFHTSHIDVVVRIAYVLAMAVLAGVYPYLIWRLTRSRIAAIFAPIFLVGATSVFDAQGFYWVPAWTIVLAMPWLWMVHKTRSRVILSVTIIGALAGLTSTFRSGTGIGPLVAAVLVGLLVTVGWRERSRVVILAVLAYLAMSTGVLDVAYQARAARMAAYPLNVSGSAGITTWSDPSGHPFWHTAYIGLGVIPNRYGIAYEDQVAAAYVRRIDPTAPYVSPRYEAILRKRVINLAEKDPSFVAKALLYKIGTELKDGLANYLLLILIMPIAVVASSGGARRRYAVVAIPISLVAFLPAVVAVPNRDYELPWFGVLACLSVVSACWLVARLARAVAGLVALPGFAVAVAELNGAVTPIVRPTTRLVRRLRGRASVAVRSAVVPLGHIWDHLVVTGRACSAVSRICCQGLLDSLRQRRRQWSPSAAIAVCCLAGIGLMTRYYLNPVTRQPRVEVLVNSRVKPIDVRLPPAIYSWSEQTLLAHWDIEPRVRVLQDASHVAVTTTPNYDAYQAQSPRRRLMPGTYTAVVQGQISVGGLEVGVLNVPADKWIETASFSSAEAYRAVTMPLQFHLTRPTIVRIILSNAARTSSRWLIQSVSLRISGRRAVVRTTPSVSQ